MDRHLIGTHMTGIHGTPKDATTEPSLPKDGLKDSR